MFEVPLSNKKGWGLSGLQLRDCDCFEKMCNCNRECSCCLLHSTPPHPPVLLSPLFLIMSCYFSMWEKRVVDDTGEGADNVNHSCIFCADVDLLKKQRRPLGSFLAVLSKRPSVCMWKGARFFSSSDHTDHRQKNLWFKWALLKRCKACVFCILRSGPSTSGLAKGRWVFCHFAFPWWNTADLFRCNRKQFVPIHRDLGKYSIALKETGESSNAGLNVWITTREGTFLFNELLPTQFGGNSQTQIMKVKAWN